MAETIRKTLADFDVPVEVVYAAEGLQYFHFHLKLLTSVRMRVIQSFADDLRFALSTDKIEIEAPIPDKKLVGIKVPKKTKAPALLWRDAVQSKTLATAGDLVLPLGQDEFGSELMLNLAKSPHILIAGATGSGKSMVLHSLISSLLYRYSPDRLRLVLIDPKRVELPLYANTPHLLSSVLYDARKSVLTLKWLIKEMERRYDVLEKTRVRDISTYHKVTGGKTGNGDEFELMPYIVVVIDEIADLMAAYPKEVEGSIVRLAQLSRAVGIHMIIATQRPSVNVVTGLMKANIPARIALQVVSNVDSRIILDQTGAEKLNGPGDLLFLEPSNMFSTRLQSYYISEDEIMQNIAKAIKKYGEFTDFLASPVADEVSLDNDLYLQAKETVMKSGKVSTSYLQRKLGIGYTRAGALMDKLEAEGIVSPGNGAEPRKVLITE